MIRNLRTIKPHRHILTFPPINPPLINTTHLSHHINCIHHPKYFYTQTNKHTQLLLRRTNKYLDLITSLKQKSQFQQYLAHAHSLFNYNNTFTDYKTLKIFINDMLLTMQIVSWAHAYHNRRDQAFFIRYLNRVEELIRLSFSTRLNSSNESLQQETSQFFETLRFSTYYQLVQKPSTQISMLYLNSYIHINRQRSPQQYLKVYQALRQLPTGETELQIMQTTQQGINEYISHLDLVGKRQKMSEVQISMTLCYLRSHLSTMSQLQIQNAKQFLINNLSHDKFDKESYLYMENMSYCLYYAITKFYLHEEICHWLQFKLTAPEPNGLIQYLATLFSHEDKLSCIKTDTWIELQLHIKQHPESQAKYRRVVSTCTFVLSEIHSLSYSTWRYKYLVWMLHIQCDHQLINLMQLHKLIQAITNQKMATNHSLSSLTLALKTLSTQLTLSQIATLDVMIAKWLSEQSKQSLLSQPKQNLFEILHYADRHPGIYPIYLPYLERLLQISLGQFEWNPLTEIYYFGLKWKAVEQSQASFWKMEYVRRYILNQYAEMGIKRRDIQQDSYFYKLLAQTTPENFYKNYIDHY